LSAEEREQAVQSTDQPQAVAVFDQQWAVTVFARALATLKEEYEVAGKAKEFEHMQRFLTRTGDKESYTELARELGSQPDTVSVAVHRMRRRYGEVVRAQIESTVNRAEDVDDELRYLTEVVQTETTTDRWPCT
jgi:RNA polymerase sigma-70 factor (ECF subfamily)